MPADGATLGELMLRGNTVMKGYLKNPRRHARRPSATAGSTPATSRVRHPDGYVEIKDRSKDIIISGGENISSLEVEECLYRHPAVMEAAVVARPDEKWGETPCAFVDAEARRQRSTAEEIIAWCREHMAHFKVPKTVVFGPLPKTSTGQDPEIRAARGEQEALTTEDTEDTGRSSFGIGSWLPAAAAKTQEVLFRVFRVFRG